MSYFPAPPRGTRTALLLVAGVTLGVASAAASGYATYRYLIRLATRRLR